MFWAYIIIQRERVALTLSGNVVLPYLNLIYYHLVVLYKVCKLCVIAAGRRILVRCGEHYSKFLLKEALAPGAAKVKLHLVAYPVVAASCCNVEERFVWGILGYKVYCAANCIAIHIACNNLVYLYCLYHIGWDKIQLYISHISLSRWESVAVYGYRAQIGRGASYLAESCLALVVLHIYSINALEGISNVSIGKSANLLLRTHIFINITI